MTATDPVRILHNGQLVGDNNRFPVDTEVDLTGVEELLAKEPIAPVHTAVTVGNASTLALAANANRRYALFVNDSDSIMYINLGNAAATNEGIRLNANGGSFEMGLEFGNLQIGAVYAISDGAGHILLVTEG